MFRPVNLLIFLNLIHFGIPCVPSGIGNGCNCISQPACGACAPNLAYSADNANQYLPQIQNYQVPPPPPPPPSFPVLNPNEYQPPPIILPDSTNQNVHQSSIPSSHPSSSASQYPSEEYQQFLSSPALTDQNQVKTGTDTMVYKSSESEATIAQVDKGDQTAYRGSYKSESSQASSHFETGSAVVPPPTDPDLELEPVKSTATTQASTTTTAPENAPGYAAVLKEVVQERKTDSLFTYANQVCTGIVAAKGIEVSVASAAHKCLEMACAAVNVRPVPADTESGEEVEDDIKYDVIYLKSVNTRTDDDRYHCVATNAVPMVSNDLDRIEAEIKLHRREGSTTNRHPTPPESPIRLANNKRRAPKLSATTFRPKIFRFATVEPKSAY